MVSVKFAPLLALLAAVASLSSTASAAPQVHAGVHRTLRQQGTVNLIVTLKEGTESTLSSIKEAEFATRGQRIASMVSSLEQHAASTQTELTKLISQEAASAQPLFAKTESYWISNQVYVKAATFEFVEKLAALDSIHEIREEQVLPLPKVQVAASNSTGITPLANEWGVTKVSAPTVWASGNTGKGVVVGGIDTGVLATHTALKANYRSTYGWYDPGAKKATPYDDNGHGTHTMGTIAGANGIGVAPGATWIACRACTADGCSESDLLACAQFMTCPTTPTGASKDCTKAPDLVSNSWGGGQGDTFYQSAVNAWVAAGIVPVFANGNEGPACKTANSPADYKNVIAVGSTTSTDGMSDFSSKGPTVGGLVKPEVSAPGSSVRSAWYTSATAYNTISGTSMATPHVSGVIALLLSAKPTLTVAQVTAAVKKGVDTTTLKASGYTCGGTTDKTYPNNQYGYGRINAAKVIAA